MAICLETETIEKFLQSLHLDKFITLFKENDIDLDLFGFVDEFDWNETNGVIDWY